MKPLYWRYVLAILSGVLLAASDWPMRLTLLHFIAFVPIFYGYTAFAQTGKQDRLSGFLFISTYGGILAAFAATVIPVWIAFFCAIIQWTLVLRVLSRILPSHWLLGPAAAASTVTLVELFIWHVVPVFGTAQCFARVTSAVPMAVQFAAYTGLAGVAFALVFSQALLASILATLGRPDAERTKKCLLLLVFIVTVAGANYVRWTRPLKSEIQVATYGWAGRQNLSLSDMCQAAVAKQAKILVTPELGFSVPRDTAESSLQNLAADVRNSQLSAAIGVARYDLHQNQALLIDDTNLNTYTKNHLIPYMEGSEPGGGRRFVMNWAGVDCGVMICQDDNFSDLARAYSRDGTQLMLVPTMDWNPICGLHFESSVMRAIENGYAICRAASGGISALISPKGEVLASHNHNLARDAVCVSESIPVGDGQPTIYARLGDWPMGFISIAIIIASFILPGTTLGRSAGSTSPG